MKFVSIRTSTIRPGTKLSFDVYVHFKEQHLKYRAEAQVFEADTLERFKNKKVKKLFIPSEHEPRYLGYLDEALNALQEKTTSLESKAEMAQDTLKQESDNIDKTLESAEAYESSKSRIHKVVDFMLAEPKALAEMLASAGLSVDDSAHGSTVSSLCLAVGTASRKVDRDQLTDLAVAGLLHDHSLKELGFDAKTLLEELPKEKKLSYRKHPELSMEHVAGKQFITPRVMRIIADHEEYGDGLGFPNKKRYAKLEVDSRIFNLCDAFDHFSIRAGKPAKECFDDFFEKWSEHYDLKFLEVLEKQVKG